MRQTTFELLIVGDNGDPYQEHVIGGKACVQAEPGKVYHVKINIYRDQSGKFPAKYLRFGLYVDGYDVQYWKRIDLSNEKLLPTDLSEPVCSKFWGFKKNVNDIRSFVFSIPSTSTTCDIKPIDYTCQGMVKLVVYEAEVSTGVYANQDGYFEAPSQQEVGESAKFWKLPSVTTSAGKKVVNEKEKFTPLPRWSNKTAEPMATLTLQYHTSAMIEFLKEFQHQLHDGVGHKRSAPVGNSGSSSSGGKYKVVKVPAVAVGSSSAGQLEVLDLTEDCSEDEQVASPTGTRRKLSDVQSNSDLRNGSSSSGSSSSASTGCSGVSTDDEPSAKRQRSEAEAEGSGEVEMPHREQLCKEIPIDEDISIVVRKKVVPFLDLSSEQQGQEPAGEQGWSTLTT